MEKLEIITNKEQSMKEIFHEKFISLRENRFDTHLGSVIIKGNLTSTDLYNLESHHLKLISVFPKDNFHLSIGLQTMSEESD